MLKDKPSSSSSTLSPVSRSFSSTGSETRSVVLGASAALIQPSARVREVPTCCSAGVPAGAARSSWNSRATLAVPGLPAASVTTALRLFGPSTPSSAARTVKFTWPAARCPASSVTTLGTAKPEPPSRSSTASPTSALEPEVGSVTRKRVLCASSSFNQPSSSESSPSSASVGALGATVSSVKSPPWLLVLGLPATSTTATLTPTDPWPRT